MDDVFAFSATGRDADGVKRLETLSADRTVVVTPGVPEGAA